MLPDGNGVDLLKYWRSQDVLAPVIFLTSKSELIDKVLGLESGANDYITKPFEPRELLARVRSHLRFLTPAKIKFNQIEIDLQKSQFTKINPSAPFYLFIPQNDVLREKYEKVGV
jgi:DNA-binding response OmpR family regulator